jgi:hypothetical protein
MIALGGAAWAKDAVMAAVTAETPSNPIIVRNGTEYSQGTYAIGTIQLFYTVPAYQFSAGYFGSFYLGMSIKEGKGNPATNYPVGVSLQQTGSANLELVPQTNYYEIGSAAWTGGTSVHIYIPAAVANNPAFQVDGAELVGNLQMVAPGGSHLDTVTTVQVHLILAHPTACLKSYSFITNNENTAEVELIQVSKNRNNQKVSSNPQNPHYINVVANICEVTQCMDARFTLNGDFQLKGAQAVKTFSSNSLIDSTAEVFDFFASNPVATPRGVTLCLTAPVSEICGSGGIPIAGGETFLVKADFEIMTSAQFPPPTQYEGFGTTLLEGGSTTNCTDGGVINPIADPNPTSVTLDAQCVDGGGKVSCSAP